MKRRTHHLSLFSGVVLSAVAGPGTEDVKMKFPNARRGCSRIPTAIPKGAGHA